MGVQLTDSIRLLFTKFTSGRNCDIYPPSRRSRAVPRDPATIYIKKFILISLLLV